VTTEYPNDADGDALRLVAQHGHDMTRQMVVDFAIDAPSEKIADICVERLKARDFISEKRFDKESGRWTVNCPVMMTPDYDEIVYFQKVLDEDLRHFGAKSDGWGTFGNSKSNPKK